MSADLSGGGTRSALATLQGKITAVAMVTAVAVLLAACAVFTAEQWRAERQSLENTQQQITAMLAPPLARAVESKDPIRVRRLIQGFVVAPQVRQAAFYNASGQLVDIYHRKGPGPYANPTTIDSRTPVLLNGARVGDLVVRRDLTVAGQFLARYLAVAAALFFAAAGLSLFLGRALARRVAAPINRLAEAMREMASDSDFARRVEPAADDELGRLTGAFNGLLERLQANDRELRVTLDQLTQARDAAEAANVQKSQFLANMSHEIRTPLNGVLAMAQIMAIGDMAEEQRERLNVIRKSGEALLEILNDILDVSKIEAGKLELDPIEFDLESVINGARDGFVAVAEKKKLALNLDIAENAWGSRLGDPARLRQIVSNLISIAAPSQRLEYAMAMNKRPKAKRKSKPSSTSSRPSGGAKANTAIEPIQATPTRLAAKRSAGPPLVQASSQVAARAIRPIWLIRMPNMKTASLEVQGRGLPYRG